VVIGNDVGREVLTALVLVDELALGRLMALLGDRVPVDVIARVFVKPPL
jgi:hypothetical protein